MYSVAGDDIQGARLAAQHLVRLGHMRIGFVGSSFWPLSSSRRAQGYAIELALAGVEPEPDWHVIPDGIDDFECGRQALRALLNSGISAAFCYNDRMAIGALLEARACGIRVPEDISIVGFDDINSGWYVIPGLTTVHQARFRMGRQAMQMVLDLLDGEAVSDVVFPCRLIERGSTAPLVAASNS